MNPLIQKMLSSDPTALARLMTYVENRSSEMPEIMAALSSRLGRVQVIGITGPPGAGKSTLVDQLIRFYRAQNKKIGVVAVDPSSPFTGGALLGDRIRMMSHAQDPGVFIRSLGSRGALGGLSRAARYIVQLYDAFGMDIVLVETVGVGQTEFDVLKVAHTTVVVLTPESGDTIQTMKAGLLETAHVFVVNKADREGADKIHQELRSMIEMSHITGLEQQWVPPIFQTQAHQGKGIKELVAGIGLHYQQALQSPSYHLNQEQSRVEEFRLVLQEAVESELEQILNTDSSLKQLQEEVKKGIKNPFESALEVKKQMKINLSRS